MARTRKGRPVSGWVIVDKPAGIGSTDIVARVRWAFDAQKAGHAGTLDPGATGLLAVALGEATKTIPFVTDALKAYAFTVRFGQATTTDDAEGEVTATSDLRPTDAAILDALGAFRGEVLQVPPDVSAVKVDGARAYDLAREGAVLDLAARPLWIERIAMTARPDADHATFEMVCGKGGYVRSVARDLGRMLGCLGHVTALRRLWSGPFDLTGAATPEEIGALARTDAILRHLRPVEAGLAGLPQVICPDESLGRLRCGNPAPVIAPRLDYDAECWASHGGRALALGHWRGGLFHPDRVLTAPEP